MPNSQPIRAGGLTEAEARLRLAEYGPNELPRQSGPGWPRLLLRQFTDVMILVLLAAAAIAALAGEIRDALMIALILAINGGIGFAQELRASRAVEALRALSAAQATVIRDGITRRIAAGDVVPGDQVVLESGDKVPADLVFVHSVDLSIDESLLTGESVPVLKSAGTEVEADAPLGDRLNMAFAGTLVVGGRGMGQVTATGANTETGRIAHLLSPQERKTPLQLRLAAFSRKLAVAAAFTCLAVFIAGALSGYPLFITFMTAVSVAVAAMPESLPVVVTILLAVGARKMARHNALIRRLPAVETLGSVTYICADKTGTLTQNAMTVVRVETEDADLLAAAMALSNDAAPDESGTLRGEPTEVALARYATEQGFERSALEQAMPRISEIPFSSDRKRMTTTHQDGETCVSFTKGAPEILLAKDPDLLADAKAMAGDGLRIIAYGRRLHERPRESDEPDQTLEIIGLVGLMDPPRAESADAIALARGAGITPVMITGDHPETAASIARQVGIANDDSEIVTGHALKEMDDAEFDRRVLGIAVYARMDPAQKIRVIQALEAQGEFVAMTGDGVNDAPALSRAHIGIAMGRGGTDVAREAADLVLLDDNFASIVAAVREGRRIYDNIRKYVRYVLACNFAEILVILTAPLLGLPLPLLPVHILWINLVTDGLPGLALAAEPAEQDIMQRPPRPPREAIVTRDMAAGLLTSGIILAGVTLAVQGWALAAGRDNWQTMVFAVLTFLQLGQALAVRSSRSLFSGDFLRNPMLLLAISGTALLQFAVIYAPLGNRMFSTAPLAMDELAICLAASLTGLVISEIMKALRRVKSLGVEPLQTAPQH